MGFALISLFMAFVVWGVLEVLWLPHRGSRYRLPSAHSLRKQMRKGGSLKFKLLIQEINELLAGEVGKGNTLFYFNTTHTRPDDYERLLTLLLKRGFYILKESRSESGYTSIVFGIYKEGPP